MVSFYLRTFRSPYETGVTETIDRHTAIPDNWSKVPFEKVSDEIKA